MRKEKHNRLHLTIDRRAARAYILRMAKAIDSGKRPAAVGYVRVSSKAQATGGGSLQAQREAIALAAVLEGLELLRVETDGGISGGASEKKRPGLKAALDAIRAGEASVLIVKHGDRLSRDSDYAGHLRTVVKEAGARLVVIDEAKDDPVRLAVGKMLAELERIRGGERMRSFHATRKAKGLSSGPAPFGMRLGAEGRLEPDPSTAATVARILALHGEGWSLREIAAGLNAAGTPGPTSAKWNAMTISKIANRQGGRP